MVSAKALCYQDKKSRGLLKLSDGEHPASAQIFGSDPVSYTHLDVYKRQAQDSGLGVAQSAARNTGQLLLKAPVSYTHLDVYKRQRLGRAAAPVQNASDDEPPRH